VINDKTIAVEGMHIPMSRHFKTRSRRSVYQ
jgi:hypothetical protein